MTFAQHKTSKYGHAVYADSRAFRGAVDLHAHMKSKNIVTASEGQKQSLILANDMGMGAESFHHLEFSSWLPFAAKSYIISPNVEDYVLVPVIAMPTELPNRNGVGFPLKELAAWRVEDGMLAYQTFRGKPVHVEHDNQDPTKGVGVIVDTALVPMVGYGGGLIWKLLLLLAIDRSKDPVYAQYVTSGEINSYSMGAWVEQYSCGYCEQPAGQCAHINLRRPRDLYVLNGKLVYRRVHGIKGFECSIVRDPAYVTAISDKLMSL